MADKPSRAVVIYGDGQAALVSSSHTHLHSFASRASCGFLSLRPPVPDETVDESQVRELAQLLDSYEYYVVRNKEPGEEFLNPTMSNRFMGLRAILFSSCSSVISFAKDIGLSALQLSELIKSTDSSDELVEEVPSESAVVSRLLQLLGISGEDFLERGEYDLVFVHIKVDERKRDIKEVDWLNKLVGGLMQTTQPGSKVSFWVHISVVLGYGTATESDEKCSLVAKLSDSDLSLLHPRQSYTMLGGNTLTDIRHHHPMLIAQWQEGVTRRDMATTFSFDEFKKDRVGANGHLQMHGSVSDKSPPSRGQSSNTGTLQRKSANPKSTMMSSVDGTIEQKCEALDWRRNIIAIGMVHNDSNQTSSHGIPFNKEEVVLNVDVIYNGEAELYAPNSFVDVLNDVGVRGFMKWDASLIRFV